MFTKNQVKKFDIQEANKHLQLLHKRNAELLTQLESKSGQLSKVEAQLEDLTKVKNSEVGKLSDKLASTEAKLEEQTKETEQWKMLVHERDVMISKLQVRCRQLEELETRLYDCRPSLETLLGLIYNFDGTEVDSQTAAKERLQEVESEAGYAQPDDADSPDAPDLPPSDTPSLHHESVTHNVVATDRVQHFLMNSVAEYERHFDTEDLNNSPLESSVVEGDTMCNNHVDKSNKTESVTACGVGAAVCGVGTAHCIAQPDEQPTHKPPTDFVDILELVKSSAGIFQNTPEFKVRDQSYPVVQL